MILDIPYVNFNDDEWIYILIEVLKGWTEITLSTTSGYDKENLRFFDGIIGLVLKHSERIAREYPKSLNYSFVNSWKYQGKLYRVMHGIMIEDEESEDGYSCILPKVEYHEMITHWTSDYTFEALMYKLNGDSEYIILEADINEHFAFDVNKFRESHNIQERYTEKEREIIFPMYKECIKEYRMTINEFKKMKEKKVQLNGKMGCI